jgi:hypothetical protein
MQPNDIVFNDEPTQRAFENVRRTIDSGQRFPNRVFLGNWEAFLFFDGDRMFDPNFVDCVKELLRVEGGLCACMSNFDASAVEDAGAPSFFVMDRQMTSDAFSAQLSVPSAAEGWIFGIDRFGCTSDVGNWSIYCEKANEIAVVAGRRGVSLGRCAAITEGLKALPIELAVARPLSYGFSARALSPEWRDRLIRNYSPGENKNEE